MSADIPLDVLRAAAGRGEAEAQYRLGFRFAHGIGVPKDLAQAFAWYGESAAQGYAKAQLAYGACLSSGRGTPVNRKMAFVWYRNAAEQGLIEAQWHLARASLGGKDLPLDPAEAVGWLRRAGEHGHALAQRTLGTLYKLGVGVPRDTTMAATWFRAADDQRARLALARPQRELAASAPTLGHRPADGTLAERIRRSPPGTTLRLAPGIYRGGLILDRPIRILGDGPRESIVIEAAAMPCISMATEEATLQGVTIRRLPSGVPGRSPAAGNEGEGAAVDVPYGRLRIVDSTIEAGELGPAVYIHGLDADPILERCRIHGTARGGILVSAQGRGVLRACDIHDNGRGGVIINGADPAIVGCKIHNNRGAGVLLDRAAWGLIEDCKIVDNGGVGVAIERMASPDIDRCAILTNATAGVVVSGGSAARIIACDIYANGNVGVVIRGQSSPDVSRCKLHHAGNYGAYVSEASEGRLEDCEIFDNGKAGVFVNQGSTPLLLRCEVRHGDGAGVSVEDSSPSIRECKIHETALIGICFVRSGGTVEGCEVTRTGHAGIYVEGPEGPAIRGCRVHHGKKSGVVWNGAGGGTLEDSEIFANEKAELEIDHASAPTISRCTLRDGQVGIFAVNEAAARVVECDIFGHSVAGVMIGKKGNPRLVRCKIHEGQKNGVTVYLEGTGRLEECSIYENGAAGVWIEDTGYPALAHCIVRSNDVGILVKHGGRHALERCEVKGNKTRDWSVDKESAPSITEAAGGGSDELTNVARVDCVETLLVGGERPGDSRPRAFYLKVPASLLAGGAMKPAFRWRIDWDAAAKGAARSIVDPIHVLVERIYHERSQRYREVNPQDRSRVVVVALDYTFLHRDQAEASPWQGSTCVILHEDQGYESIAPEDFTWMVVKPGRRNAGALPGPAVGGRAVAQPPVASAALALRDSGADLARQGSSPDLRRQGSSPNLRRHDSNAELRLRDSSAELKRHDSSAELKVAPAMALELSEDLILQYESGNEHSPTNPFGRNLMVIRGNGRVRVENYRVGAPPRAWEAWVHESALEQTLEALRVARYPLVPPHPIPAGSRVRALSIHSKGVSSQAPPIAWHSDLPGYKDAFRILDSLVRQASGEELQVTPNHMTKVVSDIIKIA